jgi:hypothetical protein
MGYLICENCGGYYELQPGESPDDFTDVCACGGKLIYSESLEGAEEDFKESETTVTCPHCGTENPEDRKICQSCKRFIVPTKTSYKTDKTPPHTPKSGNVSKELLDTWNKQSTPIKAISIIGVCCVGLILIAAIGSIFSPDKTTTQTTSTSTNTGMSESDYRNKVYAWTTDMASVADGMGNVARGLAGGYLSDGEAIGRLNSLQSTTQRVMGEMQSTTPPSKYSNIHQNLHSSVQDCNRAITLMETGITTKKSSYISQANDLINSATRKVDSATDEMNTL